MTVRAALLLAPLLASAVGNADSSDRPATRVRLGGFTVNAGYSHYSGPGWYGYPHPYYRYYPYAWHHSPLWMDPAWWPIAHFYHPGFFGGYARQDDKGEVRIAVEPGQAEVFIDGGYAGAASGLKSIWLAPGAYDIEVRSVGREPYQKRIYVLTGKTLRITAALAPVSKGAQP